MAHQFISQLSEQKEGSSVLDSRMKDAVFGNAGTMISFRIGVADAEIMAKEFAPVFNAYDLMNIEKYHAYVKLLIDNAPSRPFSTATPFLTKGDAKLKATLKKLSRLKYGRARELVEIEILERSQLGSEATNTIIEKSA